MMAGLTFAYRSELCFYYLIFISFSLPLSTTRSMSIFFPFLRRYPCRHINLSRKRGTLDRSRGPEINLHKRNGAIAGAGAGVGSLSEKWQTNRIQIVLAVSPSAAAHGTRFFVSKASKCGQQRGRESERKGPREAARKGETKRGTHTHARILNQWLKIDTK